MTFEVHRFAAVSAACTTKRTYINRSAPSVHQTHHTPECPARNQRRIVNQQPLVTASASALPCQSAGSTRRSRGSPASPPGTPAECATAREDRKQAESLRKTNAAESGLTWLPSTFGRRCCIIVFHPIHVSTQANHFSSPHRAFFRRRSRNARCSPETGCVPRNSMAAAFIANSSDLYCAMRQWRQHGSRRRAQTLNGS